jgi:acetoin utilization protein AcuB
MSHETFDPQEITVRDLMTRAPVVIGPATTVEAVKRKMREIDVRHLPVVHQGQLVGIVSSHDLGRTGQTVAEIMTEKVETANPDDRIEEAAATMAYLKVSSLPVVEGGDVVGIVTTYDILAAFVRMVRGGPK